MYTRKRVKGRFLLFLKLSTRSRYLSESFFKYTTRSVVICNCKFVFLQVRREKNDKLTFDSKDAIIKVRDIVSGKDISVNHKVLGYNKTLL